MFDVIFKLVTSRLFTHIVSIEIIRKDREIERYGRY